MAFPTKMDEKTPLVVTADPNPNKMASVPEYLQGVLPLLMGAGGKPVKRLKVDKVIHGTSSGMVPVMAFDSAEATFGMFESEDYAALVPVRNRVLARSARVSLGSVGVLRKERRFQRPSARRIWACEFQGGVAAVRHAT